MHVEALDERFSYEDGNPAYAVQFNWKDPKQPLVWDGASYKITDASLFEVLDWIEANMPPGAIRRLGIVDEYESHVYWLAGVYPEPDGSAGSFEGGGGF